MKTKILITILAVLTAFAVQAQKGKYWLNANTNSTFNFGQNYKVGILPIITNEPDMVGSLSDLAMSEISVNLTGVSKFQLINTQVFKQAVSTNCYAGQISVSCYPDICKATGAQLLVYCELSRDMNIIKKKEVSTVMAYIQVFDASNDFTVVYTAKARSINPLSAQAEMEGAIRKALEGLITKMQ